MLSLLHHKHALRWRHDAFTAHNRPLPTKLNRQTSSTAKHECFAIGTLEWKERRVSVLIVNRNRCRRYRLVSEWGRTENMWVAPRWKWRYEHCLRISETQLWIIECSDHTSHQSIRFEAIESVAHSKSFLRTIQCAIDSACYPNRHLWRDFNQATEIVYIWWNCGFGAIPCGFFVHLNFSVWKLQKKNNELFWDAIGYKLRKLINFQCEYKKSIELTQLVLFVMW